MSGPSAGPNKGNEASKSRFTFPKSARLLRRKDFQRVYEQGFRVVTAYFTAFCARSEPTAASRVGLAAARTLGKAVRRNRIKRRLREAVRLQRWRLPEGWDIVIQAREGAADAPFAELMKAVERLFARCRS